ncbi:short-chain dehydrogenase/reductase SDR [Mycobacteroides abscessus subsp. bolletii]|nr:short-chain dehydrogenase/reductase SDR [Mycobacteroides abscessus subsp. bolletii]
MSPAYPAQNSAVKMTAMLEGKTAIITGAARGLGRAIALAYAVQGADLFLSDVASHIPDVPYDLGTLRQLEHTASVCEQAGAAVEISTGDVRSSRDTESVAAGCLERFGRIDILVNNAGIVSPSGKAVHLVEDSEWQIMLETNLYGPWRMIKAVAPSMLCQSSGSIINVASTAGLVGYKLFSGYAASKHGLIGLTKAAALDLGESKVRVNAICPGSVRDTWLHEGVMLKEIARTLGLDDLNYAGDFLHSQPLKELVEPESVASAAVWLGSDGSEHVTGSSLVVDGGYTIR